MADLAQQKRAFLNFLDEEGYTGNVTRMLNKSETRLRLNLNDLRKHDAKARSAPSGTCSVPALLLTATLGARS